MLNWRTCGDVVNLVEPEKLFHSEPLHRVDPGRIAPIPLIVQAKAEQEPVFCFHAGEIGPETGRNLAVVALVHQDRHHYPSRPLLTAIVGNGRQGNAFVQDVVQEQHRSAPQLQPRPDDPVQTRPGCFPAITGGMAILDLQGKRQSG